MFLVPFSLLPAPAQPGLYQKDDFYKAEGTGIGVKWEVPRTTVEDGGELTATLVISRATNPTKIVRPDLKALPAFADAFTVTDVPDAPPKADAKEVRFTYKLKPRNRSVKQVPELTFRYFNPAAAPKNAYPPTMADPVPITVTEPPTKLIPLVPMTEADRLFRIATGPEVLEPPLVPCGWGWLAAALFGPLAAGGWFLVWRRLYPGAARLAHLRRSWARRRATNAIRRAHRAPDPPATIAAAVLGYLRSRFPIPESAVTPSEIGATLVEAHVPAEVAEQIADVFRACDRARFAPANDDRDGLTAAARAAVTRVEELA